MSTWMRQVYAVKGGDLGDRWYVLADGETVR